MQQLSLKQRPARRAIGENMVWMTIATFGTMAVGAIATTTDERLVHTIYLFFSSALLLIWVSSVIDIIHDQRYNRSLPECIEHTREITLARMIMSSYARPLRRTRRSGPGSVTVSKTAS